MEPLKELVRFREWLTLATHSPQMKPVESKRAQRITAPMPFTRLHFLMRMCSMNRDEALDMPLVLANALYATWADFDGKGELHFAEGSAALWDFARQEDARRFNLDGTRKAMN
jgi:hypothetical protein